MIIKSIEEKRVTVECEWCGMYSEMEVGDQLFEFKNRCAMRNYGGHQLRESEEMQMRLIENALSKIDVMNRLKSEIEDVKQKLHVTWDWIKQKDEPK